MPTVCPARVGTLGTRWTTLTQTVGFCDLLGTPYAPVSKIPSVKVSENKPWNAASYLNHLGCDRLVFLLLMLSVGVGGQHKNFVYFHFISASFNFNVVFIGIL